MGPSTTPCAGSELGVGSKEIGLGGCTGHHDRMLASGLRCDLRRAYTAQRSDRGMPPPHLVCHIGCGTLGGGVPQVLLNTAMVNDTFLAPAFKLLDLLQVRALVLAHAWAMSGKGRGVSVANKPSSARMR